MPLSAGEKLGPYEILSPIGKGGMGEVWRARDTRLHRIVALKQLNGQHTNRFEQEARAIAAMNHPHICQIYDVGPDFLVLEYVEGAPIGGPMATADALRAALQIASALEAAHAKGILHRDLKPGNIMMTAAGAKLLDFGLAKLITDEDATHTIGISGTPVYMSPEQAEGKPLDARSDIFSFGAVLYEVVAGRRAFDNLVAVLRDEPRMLDSPLAGIVSRCLAKRITERFQNIADVKGALERLLAKPMDQRPSVAVLPFANMGGNKEEEYFSDGLAEEIINALTKVSGLRVIARASAFRFRGEPDLRKIGDTLRVRTLLEGSVRRAGNRLRVTAQLVNIEDDSPIWSERYDRELADVFVLQDEISLAIVDALKVQLVGSPNQPQGPHTLVRRKTANPEAFQACLEGRYQFLQYTVEGIRRSQSLFERAIELDPNYADAYGALAEYFIYRTLYESVPTMEAAPQALAAADRAVALDPNEASGYMARALIRGLFHHDWMGEGPDLEAALRLSPESPFVRYRRGIWYLLPLGRIEEAVAEVQRAIESDPLSLVARGVECFVLSVAGRTEMALRRSRACLEMFPNSFLAAFLAGGAMAGCGAPADAAVALSQAMIANPGNPWLRVILAGIYTSLGSREEACRIAAEFEEESQTQHVPSLVRGMAQAAAGDLNAAFHWLDVACDERQVWLMAVLLMPLYRTILDDPRRNALLRKANITAR